MKKQVLLLINEEVSLHFIFTLKKIKKFKLLSNPPQHKFGILILPLPIGVSLRETKQIF